MTLDIGYRIRLIHTNDKYTKLKQGDLENQISDVTYLPEDLWRSRSNLGTFKCCSILALIDGQVEWEARETMLFWGS